MDDIIKGFQRGLAEKKAAEALAEAAKGSLAPAPGQFVKTWRDPVTGEIKQEFIPVEHAWRDPVRGENSWFVLNEPSPSVPTPLSRNARVVLELQSRVREIDPRLDVGYNFYTDEMMIVRYGFDPSSCGSRLFTRHELDDGLDGGGELERRVRAFVKAFEKPPLMVASGQVDDSHLKPGGLTFVSSGHWNSVPPELRTGALYAEIDPGYAPKPYWKGIAPADMPPISPRDQELARQACDSWFSSMPSGGVPISVMSEACAIARAEGFKEGCAQAKDAILLMKDSKAMASYPAGLADAFPSASRI